MSTVPKPDAPTVEDVERLTRALESEREAHKATKAELAAHATGDVEKAIASRLESHKAEADAALASVSKERDEARTRLADVESRWAGEKVDRALTDALARSGVLADFRDDALAIARNSFGVNERGEVVTKAGAAGVVPGATPDQFVIGQLRSMKPAYWPKSAGGGAGGSGKTMYVADDSCFKPGPTWNVTKQAQFCRVHGDRAAEAAARRYGTTPFGLG